MALSTLLKTVPVVPLGSPLDSGTSAAGVVAKPADIYGIAGLVADGLGQNGRATGEGALIQSHNAHYSAFLNQALTACGAATATVTSQAKTVNTLTYTIDGVFKSKVATDNFWTLTGTAVTAGGSGATMHYALCINAAGAASVVQGPTNQGSTTAWTPAPANQLPADICIAAVMKISLTAATVFTPGTTLLGAAGVTTTYGDGMDGTLWGAYLVTAPLI
jgi:hypothetical protein